MSSKQLVLTSAMAATLASLPGCASNDDWNDGEIAAYDTRVCVDQNGYRVDDFGCDDGYIRGSGNGWYYVGRRSRIPYWGDSVYDTRYGFTGSKTPTAGAVYAPAPSSTAMTRSAAVARGGFGSSSRGFGGGRS